MVGAAGAAVGLAAPDLGEPPAAGAGSVGRFLAGRGHSSSSPCGHPAGRRARNAYRAGPSDGGAAGPASGAAARLTRGARGRRGRNLLEWPTGDERTALPARPEAVRLLPGRTARGVLARCSG